MIGIVALFPLTTSADTQHLGKCGDACNCAENLIVNGGDGDEKFPIDKDPDGDDSENYKLNEVGSLHPDPNESAVGVVAEEWLMTPDEILADLQSRL